MKRKSTSTPTYRHRLTGGSWGSLSPKHRAAGESEVVYLRNGNLGDGEWLQIVQNSTCVLLRSCRSVFSRRSPCGEKQKESWTKFSKDVLFAVLCCWNFLLPVFKKKQKKKQRGSVGQPSCQPASQLVAASSRASQSFSQAASQTVSQEVVEALCSATASIW